MQASVGKEHSPAAVQEVTRHEEKVKGAQRIGEEKGRRVEGGARRRRSARHTHQLQSVK
jgi:hypothetical protein